MKNKIKFLSIITAVLCILCVATTETWAAKKYATAGSQYQEHSNWCWAATCRNAIYNWRTPPS